MTVGYSIDTQHSWQNARCHRCLSCQCCCLLSVAQLQSCNHWIFSAYILAWEGLPGFWFLSYLLLLVQEMLSSVRETQQGQDFLETQAAADQLQLHLAQSLQGSEEAVADESAKEEAFRQASFSEHLGVHD